MKPCARCGGLYVGKIDGIQRSGEPGVPGYECGTCDCGQSRMTPLPSASYVREKRCLDIAIAVAGRDDIPSAERQRLLKDIFEELTEAQRETRRNATQSVARYDHA